VAPNGDVFVANQSPGGGVLALRDTDGDGKADQTAQFGTSPGNGIYFKSPYLYFAPNDRIERYHMSPASLTPVSGPEVIVSGLPANGSHRTKTIVVTDSGTLFVGVGRPRTAVRCAGKWADWGSILPRHATRAGIGGMMRTCLVRSTPDVRFAELRTWLIALNPPTASYTIQHGEAT
jgi:glucose/arabinose dehydrogenase